MKKSLISFIAMCFIVTAMFAQKADVLVSYDVKTLGWSNDSISTSRMSLLANSSEAKFFNDLSLWSDSLSSTPDGKKQLKQIIMVSCMTQGPDGFMTFDMRKGPVKTEYTYVFSNIGENRLRNYGKYGEDLCYYDEPLDEQVWEIGDSTTTILGYECMVAQANYHGRKWTAWFAPEIPLSFGPWKLHGLPGLILKAEADNGKTYIATGLEKTDRNITPMYSADSYQKTDRKKALVDKEYYMNNHESILKAKFGGNVKIQSNGGERPKYDASRYADEPDYKELK